MAELSDRHRDELLGVLAEARDLGFLGPGPLEFHVEHSRAFVMAWPDAGSPPERILDLGSGGGVPGLVLAYLWPQSTIVLLDGSTKRTAFLESAVTELRLGPRVRVVGQRAEDGARGPLRSTFDLVTARGFAPAAVTAECAAPFLRKRGSLIVAEPPTSQPGRWPPEPLTQLGLEPAGRLETPFHLQILRRVGKVPDRFPRRVGIPAKRPLWEERRTTGAG